MYSVLILIPFLDLGQRVATKKSGQEVTKRMITRLKAGSCDYHQYTKASMLTFNGKFIYAVVNLVTKNLGMVLNSCTMAIIRSLLINTTLTYSSTNSRDKPKDPKDPKPPRKLN